MIFDMIYVLAVAGIIALPMFFSDELIRVFHRVFPRTAHRFDEWLDSLPEWD